MDSEYVPVSEEFKSRVIGRDGSVLNSIRERSGAIITSRYTEEEGFTVSGNDQQRETAKRLILEKVVSWFFTYKRCGNKIEIPEKILDTILFGSRLVSIS